MVAAVLPGAMLPAGFFFPTVINWRVWKSQKGGAVRFFSLLVALAVSSAALPSAAWAGWACGARGDDGSLVRWWGSSSAEEASRNVMDSCAKARIHCEIISCKPGVDNQETAHQVWPQAGPVTQCFGSGSCQTGDRKY